MGGEVKKMRAVLAAIGVAVVVVGCGRAQQGPVSGDYKLYVAASTQTAQQVSIIDSRSHSVERSLPLGTSSPDWSHLYTVRSSTLVDIDPQTGGTRHTLQLPGGFGLPIGSDSGVPGGLSQNGRWLVLVAPAPAESHLLVVDTTYATKPLQINLLGHFEFDAISNDGSRVYVIEYTNSTSNSYRVRVYEVSAGQLGSYTVVDKGGSPEPMTGFRLSGVPSPDGQWLYSVYARQDGGAFVHALNLTQPFAFCLDLPGSSSSANAFQWSLALSSDGHHLYAANGALGVVTQIDNLDGYNPGIVRTSHIGVTGLSASWFVQDVQAKELGPNGAVLSPDGKTLVMAATSGVVWVDTTSLKVRSHELNGWRVGSLGASPDGKMVYVVSDAGKIAELSMDDSHVATSFDGAPGQPMALVRVESASGP
jgi:hypothetical protein